MTTIRSREGLGSAKKGDKELAQARDSSFSRSGLETIQEEELSVRDSELWSYYDEKASRRTQYENSTRFRDKDPQEELHVGGMYSRYTRFSRAGKDKLLRLLLDRKYEEFKEGFLKNIPRTFYTQFRRIYAHDKSFKVLREKIILYHTTSQGYEGELMYLIAAYYTYMLLNDVKKGFDAVVNKITDVAEQAVTTVHAFRDEEAFVILKNLSPNLALLVESVITMFTVKKLINGMETKNILGMFLSFFQLTISTTTTQAITACMQFALHVPASFWPYSKKEITIEVQQSAEDKDKSFLLTFPVIKKLVAAFNAFVSSFIFKGSGLKESEIWHMVTKNMGNLSESTDLIACLVSSFKTILDAYRKFMETKNPWDLLGTDPVLEKINAIREMNVLLVSPDRSVLVKDKNKLLTKVLAFEKECCKNLTDPKYSKNPLFVNECILLKQNIEFVQSNNSFRRKAPLGVILTGPPGIGKTSMVNQFAAMAKNYFEIPQETEIVFVETASKHQTVPPLANIIHMNDFPQKKDAYSEESILVKLQTMVDTEALKAETASLSEKARAMLAPSAVFCSTNMSSVYLTQTKGLTNKVDRRYLIVHMSWTEEAGKLCGDDFDAIWPLAGDKENLISYEVGYMRNKTPDVIDFTIQKSLLKTKNRKEVLRLLKAEWVRKMEYVSPFQDTKLSRCGICRFGACDCEVTKPQGETVEDEEPEKEQEEERRYFSGYEKEYSNGNETPWYKYYGKHPAEIRKNLLGRIHSWGVTALNLATRIGQAAARRKDRINDPIAALDRQVDFMNANEGNLFRNNRFEKFFAESSKGNFIAMKMAKIYDSEQTSFVLYGVVFYSIYIYFLTYQQNKALEKKLEQGSVHGVVKDIPNEHNYVQPQLGTKLPWLTTSSSLPAMLPVILPISREGMKMHAMVMGTNLVYVPSHFFLDGKTDIKSNTPFILHGACDIKLYYNPRFHKKKGVDASFYYVQLPPVFVSAYNYLLRKEELPYEGRGFLKETNVKFEYARENDNIYTEYASTIAGDCGFPLYWKEKILGGHRAVIAESLTGKAIRGVVQPITKEMVEEAVSELEMEGVSSLFPKQGEELPVTKIVNTLDYGKSDFSFLLKESSPAQLAQGGMLEIGTLPGVERNNMTCAKTTYHHVFSSFLQEEYSAPYSGHAKLIDGNYVSPYVKRFNIPTVWDSPYQQDHEEAVRHMIKLLPKAIGKSVPTTLYTALVGHPDTPYIGPRDNTKSVGPRNKWLGITVKSAVREQEGSFVIHPDVQKRYDYLLSCFKDNELPLLYTSGQKKDECLPVSKVQKGKCRLFWVAELEFNFILKMYFSPISSFLLAQKERCGFAAGINPGTQEWGNMLKHLMEVNNQEDGMMLDMDDSEFDMRHCSVVPYASLYFALVAKHIGYSEEDVRMVTRLVRASFSRITVQEGVLVACTTKEDSGLWITLLINSAIKLITIFSYANYRSIPLTMVRPVSVGDDLLACFNKQYSDLVENQSIVHYHRTLGYSVTPARKDDTGINLKNFSEVTFLKRGFRKDGEYIKGALSKETIYKALSYSIKSSIPQAERDLGTSLCMVKEMYLHGEEEYTRLVSLLNGVNNQVYRSYSYYDEQFKNGKLTLWEPDVVTTTRNMNDLLSSTRPQSEELAHVASCDKERSQ